MKFASFLLLVIFLSSACKKDKSTSLTIDGTVSSALNGIKLSNASVVASQKVVIGGVFNNNYVTAASASTDGGGAYRLAWENESPVAVKVDVTCPGYISQAITVDPSSLSVTATKTINVALHTASTISVHMQNTGASASNDVCLFRFENALFDCVCCNNDWKTFNGPSVNESFTCKSYGGQWLKYRKSLQTIEIDTLIHDSVFVPSFETVNIEVNY